MTSTQRRGESNYISAATTSYNPTPIDGAAVILVTAGYDHTLRFWEALSGVCMRTIQHPDSQVNRVAISPDKRYLAAASAVNVRIYEIQTSHPNPIATFDAHTGNITGLAFQNECRWMATGSEDGTIKIWDMRTTAPQRDYDHQGPVTDLIIHPNQGELISCDQNGSIKIWDLSNNSCTHELVPQEDVPMRAVAIAGDASLLAAANDSGRVFIWRMFVNCDGRLDLMPLAKIDAHSSKHILRLSISPDISKLATCGADGVTKIWEIDPSNTKWPLLRTLEGHTRWVWDCVWSADSAYIVTASSDCTARLWDSNSGQCLRQYTGHQKAVVCVAMNDIS